jgi:hypothetical protein
MHSLRKINGVKKIHSVRTNTQLEKKYTAGGKINDRLFAVEERPFQGRVKRLKSEGL